MIDAPACVLVTGASGNVGRQVMRACSTAGLRVVAADFSLPSQPRDTDPPSVALDFTNRDTWVRSLDGVDLLFLLRPPPISDMKATLNPYVDTAYAAGVRHVVFLSVSGAEKNSWVPHRKVEDHLRAIPAGSGRGWTVLRPGFFAQNMSDAYRRDIVEDGRIYVPAGGAHVAFVDAWDIGDATAAVLADPAHYERAALTLTGPRAITFDEAAATLSRTIGRPVRYQAARIVGYGRHLRRRGLPWAQVAVQTVLHVGLRRGDAEHVDPTLPRLLGRAATSFEDFVTREHAVWDA